MKKVSIILISLAVVCAFIFAQAADAARKSSKKTGMTAEQIKQLSTEADNLTMLMYSRTLFTPADNEKLIQMKIQLDNQMDSAPDLSLAPIYYKIANLYKAREMNTEAIDCYQTILENFSDTMYAPKASKELNLLGVKVNPAPAP